MRYKMQTADGPTRFYAGQNCSLRTRGNSGRSLCFTFDSVGLMDGHITKKSARNRYDRLADSSSSATAKKRSGARQLQRCCCAVVVTRPHY